MPDAPPQPGHALTVWRTLTLAGFILAAISIALAVGLFLKVTAAGQENRATICSIGSFLVAAPPERRPGISHDVFVKQLHNAEAFLRDLRDIDCDDAELGTPVTREEIERQLDAIRRAKRDERQREPSPQASATPTAPTSTSTTTPAPAPAKAPTTTSSGGSPPPSGPPQGPPPGVPPPNPPPNNPPPLLDVDLDGACQISLVGLRVCVGA